MEEKKFSKREVKAKISYQSATKTTDVIFITKNKPSIIKKNKTGTGNNNFVRKCNITEALKTQPCEKNQKMYDILEHNEAKKNVKPAKEPNDDSWAKILDTGRSSSSVTKVVAKSEKYNYKRIPYPSKDVPKCLRKGIDVHHSKKSSKDSTRGTEYRAIDNQFHRSNKQQRSHPTDTLNDETHTPFGCSALDLLRILKERLKSTGDSESSDLVSILEKHINCQGSGRTLASGKIFFPGGNPTPYPPVFETPNNPIHQCERNCHNEEDLKVIEEQKEKIEKQESEIGKQKIDLKKLKQISDELLEYYSEDLNEKKLTLQESTSSAELKEKEVLKMENNKLKLELNQYVDLIINLERRLLLAGENRKEREVQSRTVSPVPNDLTEGDVKTKPISKDSEADSAFDDQTASRSASSNSAAQATMSVLPLKSDVPIFINNNNITPHPSDASDTSNFYSGTFLRPSIDTAVNLRGNRSNLNNSNVQLFVAQRGCEFGNKRESKFIDSFKNVGENLFAESSHSSISFNGEG